MIIHDGLIELLLKHDWDPQTIRHYLKGLSEEWPQFNARTALQEVESPSVVREPLRPHEIPEWVAGDLEGWWEYVWGNVRRWWSAWLHWNVQMKRAAFTGRPTPRLQYSIRWKRQRKQAFVPPSVPIDSILIPLKKLAVTWHGYGLEERVYYARVGYYPESDTLYVGSIGSFHSHKR